MEAKGCAKPAVWKDARRHFYWAVRARVAKSAALAQIAEASPRASLDYRTRLLNSLASLEPTTSYRETSEKLESLDISQTVVQLKADHLVHQLIELAKEDKKATLDGFLRVVDQLSDEDRQSLMGVLQSPKTGEFKFGSTAHSS